jgi:hypothetical protein
MGSTYASECPGLAVQDLQCWSQINAQTTVLVLDVCCMRPGMFEAGTFPAMWAHLTKFYAGGPDLTAAWGFIGAAQPLAQVRDGYPGAILHF